MILEMAILQVRPGQADAFRTAFAQAEPIIAAARGYLSHELQRCVEDQNRFLLLVRWARLQDHTEGFRGSADYQRWRGLLHHFYDPFPEVHHYEMISGSAGSRVDV